MIKLAGVLAVNAVVPLSGSIRKPIFIVLLDIHLA